MYESIDITHLWYFNHCSLFVFLIVDIFFLYLFFYGGHIYIPFNDAFNFTLAIIFQWNIISLFVLMIK